MTKKKVLTTADGVDIYEGDEFYCLIGTHKCDDEMEWVRSGGYHRAGIGKLDVKNEWVRERCFSTEDAAFAAYDKRKLGNTPCLSANDIKYWIEKYFNTDNINVSELVQLAKKKIEDAK